jgi:undecaprenyl-diphosphatase
LDDQISVALNQWVMGDPPLANLCNILSNNGFFRGAPLVAGLCLVWCAIAPRDRLRLAAQLLAVCAAVVLSLGLQHLNLVHLRPFLQPALHIRLPASITVYDWVEDRQSWPSDTATLYAGLAAVVWFNAPKLGPWLAAWTFVVVLLPRVAFGYHFASDVASGVVLGTGAVALANVAFSAWRRRFGDRIASAIERHPARAHALFIFAVWQMADLMIDPRVAFKAVRVFLHSGQG